MMAASTLLVGEEVEWSASTVTLPQDETSPRSIVEEEDEDDEAWAVQRRDRKGLRALLRDMDVEDPPPSSSVRKRRPAVDEDESGDEVEGTTTAAARAELRLAEERVRSLEARLLDAEETIYHLKAEKMDAWRRVEKLTRQSSMASMSEDEGGAGGEVVRLRSQVFELENQLEELKNQHALELEQQMAVIREQERELLVLKDRLTDLQDHADDVEARYEQLATRQKQIEYEQKEEEEDDDPVKMLGQNAPVVDDTSAMSWREEIVRHPTPHFDLDSPEIQYLLSSWTKNPKKLQYLRTWLLHVALQHDRELPMDFPMGIELPRLAPEIRDGFLTLVVPLLRKQPWREIQVHTKQYNDQFHTDLRIRVVSRRP